MKPSCGSDPPTELNLQKSIALYPTRISPLPQSITSSTAALLPDIHRAAVSHPRGSNFSLGKLHHCVDERTLQRHTQHGDQSLNSKVTLNADRVTHGSVIKPFKS